MDRLELCCVATKRSGHHAFLEWLLTHRPGGYAYFNNVNPQSPTLVGTAFESSSDALTADRHDDASTLVTSFENKPLEAVLSSPALAQAPGRRRLLILLVRDPINVLASATKILEEKPAQARDHERWLSDFKTAWVNHAKEFLGQTSLTETSPWEPMKVSYNLYIRDAAYRDAIAAQLGMNGSDLLTGLSRFGRGGNTFFGNRKSYKPDVQALESRWRDVGSTHHISQALRDPMFRDLAVSFYETIGLWNEFEPAFKQLSDG